MIEEVSARGIARYDDERKIMKKAVEDVGFAVK